MSAQIFGAGVPVFGFDVSNLHREVPVVAFEVFDTVTLIAVEGVLDFRDDVGAFRFTVLEVLLEIVHIDIQLLGGLSEPSGRFVFLTGTAQHEDRVVDLPTSKQRGGAAVCPLRVSTMLRFRPVVQRN